MAKRRTQLWIDRNLQGTVILRFVYYWFVSLLFVTIPLVILETLVDPSKLFYHHLVPLFVTHWPVYVALTLLLPFMLFDALKLTHRIAGPIYQARVQLRSLAEGKDVKPICFREEDFWQDMADEINRIAELRKRENVG